MDFLNSLTEWFLGELLAILLSVVEFLFSGPPTLV